MNVGQKAFICLLTQWLFILPSTTAGPKERAGLMPQPVKLICKWQHIKRISYAKN